MAGRPSPSSPPSQGKAPGLPFPAGTTSLGLYSMGPVSGRSGGIRSAASSDSASLANLVAWFQRRPLVFAATLIAIVLLSSVVMPFIILSQFSGAAGAGGAGDATGGAGLLSMTSSKRTEWKHSVAEALGVEESDMDKLARHGKDYAASHNAAAGIASPHEQRLKKAGLGKSAASAPPSPANLARADAVRQAFLHAYTPYEAVCFGEDEFHPLSRRCSNWVNSGLTIIDALPTMILMGLDKEVARARAWVETKMDFAKSSGSVSFFETTIRVLGGLVSAHDLTGDALYLAKAKDLATRLLPAFNTPSGLPRGQVSLSTGQASDHSWTGGNTLLAEVGTCQMEFGAVSARTGDDKFRLAAQKPIDLLDKLAVADGLYPLFMSTSSGTFTNSKISFGAMGDSFYEYLLKQWLLTGRVDEQLKRMYRASIAGMFRRLYTNNGEANGDYFFLADVEIGQKILKMDHLVCFAPGMLALGVEEGIVSGEEAEQHMKGAEQLMRTCYSSYSTQPSKIGPEVMLFTPALGIGEASYKLRPEMVESLFVMWRVTRDEKYRDWAWATFQAIETHCKIPSGGYAALMDVRRPDAKEDKMESFFLAETLKYLFLTFSPDDVLVMSGQREPGEYFVFNTEAHPIKSWRKKD